MHLINKLYSTLQQCVARLLQEGNHPVFILQTLQEVTLLFVHQKVISLSSGSLL